MGPAKSAVESGRMPIPSFAPRQPDRHRRAMARRAAHALCMQKGNCMTTPWVDGWMGGWGWGVM